MFSLRNKMIAILSELQSKFSAVAVKADFEAEGTNLSELVFLNELVCSVGLKLFLKIGGAEAVFDLNQAKLFGAKAVIVPVVESEFALKKFMLAFNRVFRNDCVVVEKILNAETKTCAENFDKIMQMGSGFLNSVTIGRVDLADSLNLSRNEIDSSVVFKMCQFFFERAKKFGLNVGLGGGLGVQSFKFLSKLKFDRFETRKIVFKNEHDELKFRNAILKSTEFELFCLQFKKNIFQFLACDDELRISMLKKRLSEF